MNRQEQLRFECLKLALGSGFNPLYGGVYFKDTLEAANLFYDFVVGAADGKSTVARRDVVANINFDGN